MERYMGIIAVTVADLTNEDGGFAVMSRNNYDNLIRRKLLTILRPGKGRGNYALIEYASLPKRFKERYVQKYGDPEETMKEDTLTLMPDPAARLFFANYTLASGLHIQEPFQNEYLINAQVLNALLDAVNTQKARHKAGNNSTPVFWGNIAALSEELRERYHHTLPKSEARLRAKLREYARDGYACLVSGKLGNGSAVRLPKEGEELCVACMRSKNLIYSTAMILEKYNREAERNGWKKLKSEATISNFLNRPDVKPRWYDARYGELAAKQLYSRRNKTKMPTMRDSLWYGDGTKLNLFYKAYEGGKLVVKTAYVYEVCDAFSNVLLGYAIGKTENFDLQYRAFRMAIETSGHKPWEIVTDNQGSQKKKEAQTLFSSMAVGASRTTAPYTPQAKSIEQLFGQFQNQVLRKDWRFTGGNISAKEAWRIDREFIEANKEKLYTFEELVEAYAKAREEWNAMNGRMDAYLASVNPKTPAVSDVDMVDMFWVRTSRAVSFTADGITVQFRGQKRTFEVYTEKGLPDYDWRMQNTGKAFVVKYDPLTMDQALLYEETASGIRFVTAAYPYLEVQRNIQEQTEGDMALIRHNDRENKRVRVVRRIQAKQLEMEYGVAPEQHGLKTPALKGISEKEFEALADEFYSKTVTTTEPVSVGEYTKAVSNMDYDPSSAIGRL